MYLCHVSIVKQSMQTRYLGSIASVHLVHPRCKHLSMILQKHMLLGLLMVKSPAHWKFAHLEEDPDKTKMVTNTVQVRMNIC